MNRRYILPLIVLLSSSCSQQNFVLADRVFCFGPVAIDITLFEGNKDDLKEIRNILEYYDKISDNYLARDITNVYTLNHTDETVTVSSELYNLLKTSMEVTTEGAKYFNLLSGSLAKKWKESLSNGQILPQNEINTELEKLNNSSLTLYPNNMVKRSGESEIDLGGIAKGYALDVIKDYLDSKEYKSYIINAGSSSILLGEKNGGDGYFTVETKEDYPGHYFKAKNCVVSTSSNSRQGVTIDSVTYSHIINPTTGGAITEYDAVIVLSESGYLGDALSTSLMNSTEEEIKVVEELCNVKVLTIKNSRIAYKSEDFEIYE